MMGGAWWDKYPCFLVPAVPCSSSGPMLRTDLMGENVAKDPFLSLRSGNVTAIGVKTGAQLVRDVATQQTESETVRRLGGEKALNRWRIVEIAWLKAFYARLNESGLLKDPRVASLAEGTQDAADLNNVIQAATAGAAVGAAGGTLVPGIGNVVGGLVGGIGGAVAGLVQWAVNASGDQERRHKVSQALGAVVQEVGYPPSRLALVIARDKVAGVGGIHPFKTLGTLAKYTEAIYQRETPIAWGMIPAFPWKVKDSTGERVITAQQAAQSMWTVKERSLSIWPYLDAPLLTFVTQQVGDTPECSSAASRPYDRAGRAFLSLSLVDVFPSLQQMIEIDGSINPALAKSAGKLTFQNQYSARAQGSQAGVLLPNIPCTAAISLDVPMLAQWGRQ